ncbi:MAG: histidinol dehydrogenase [Gemmatimonadaceae bacterium]|nr:histidinol dehydrogenase [Gemmatimonadaceae bacterium]
MSTRPSNGLLPLRFRGAARSLTPELTKALFDRGTADNDVMRDTVSAIIDAVRHDGDSVLKSLAREYDHVTLKRLDVPKGEWTKALDALDPAVRTAMERSARNIEAAHRAFVPGVTEVETEPGIIIGRRPDALGSVGVYAPGGRAAYPSSVLMGAIPARVAGVGEIVLCSPPGSNGLPSPAVLAACAIAKVDRVFALGGAGAIAAMAYGTQSVPRVDRIVGPGNAWVTEAKVQVAKACAIDSPAGPSELLVIADGSADTAQVAREILAQAEHDPMACVVAVAIGDDVAARIETALETMVGGYGRSAIIRQALEANGGVLSVDSLEEAVRLANAYAAEHLLLAVADPGLVLPALRNQGTIFMGTSASVSFGDYMTGANHTLPTNGLARSYSGLSTLDFIRWTTYQRVTPEAAARLAADVGAFAEAEGLDGHARAARAWGRPGGAT